MEIKTPHGKRGNQVQAEGGNRDDDLWAEGGNRDEVMSSPDRRDEGRAHVMSVQNLDEERAVSQHDRIFKAGAAVSAAQSQMNQSQMYSQIHAGG